MAGLQAKANVGTTALVARTLLSGMSGLTRREKVKSPPA